MKRLTVAFLSGFIAFCVVTPNALAQSGEAHTIPLVVMNQDGQIVEGLTLQNVRIKPATASVQNIALDVRPRRIVLLVDMSGSMSALLSEGKHITALDYTKDMAKVFLQTLLRQDSVALDIFGDKEKQIVSFTHDFASIKAAINALPQPRGTTLAGDALQAALRDLGPTPGFGDSIVFFSDGQFELDTSDKLIESQRADLGRCAVRIFLVLPVTSHLHLPLSELMPVIENEMNFMDETGGFAFTPSGFPGYWPTLEIRSDPIHEIASLSNAIHGTYRVELQFTHPIRRKRKLQLEIVDNKGKNMRNVYVLYPHALYQ